MTNEFIDRIVRPAERGKITGLGDMQTRRLEARGDFPLRFKLCPDSGPYGATGWMLSWLLAWTQWRAAGGPGSWAEWWAATAAESDTGVGEQAAKRDGGGDIGADHPADAEAGAV